MTVEHELADDPERLALLIAGINPGVWDWNITRDEVWYSPVFYHLLGIAGGETGNTYAAFLDLLHPQDRTLMQAAVEEQLREGKLYRLEIRMRHQSGSYRWFATSGYAAFDEVGQPRRLCGTIVDITGKKQLQRELEARELLLEEVCTMTRSGGWEVDLATGRSYWSRQVYDICQMPYDYAPSLKDALSFYTPESKVLLGHRVEAAVSQGQPWDVELQLVTGQGRTIWVRALGKPVFDEQGRVTELKGVFQDIDERKRAEGALRESEARWQFALEGAGDGLWDWNATTNKVFFSRQWKQMLGYEAHEIGDSLDEWEKRMHPQDRERCWYDLQQHFQGKTPYYANEHRVLCKNGDYKWILDRGQVIERDAAGNPLRMIGTHTDISRRKQVEEALRRSEEKFKAIFHATYQFTGLLSPEGTLLDANQAALTFAGLLPEEVLHKKFWDTHWWQISPGIGQQLQESIARAAAGEFVRYTVDVQGEAGRRATIDFSIKPLADMQGQVTQLVVEGRDITERVLAEQALRESEEKFYALFSLSPIGLALTDLETGRFLNFNQALLDSTGYSAEELNQKSFGQITPEVYAPLDGEQVARLEEQGQYGPFEKEYFRKDGTRLPVQLNGLLMRDRQGKKLVWSFIEDISARKAREREIELLNRKLLASNTQKDKLLSILSHDLRSPINTVEGLLSLLQEELGPLLSAEQSMLFGKVQQSVGNTYLLLDELLIWSLTQADRLIFSPAWFSLGEVFEKVFSALLPQLTTKDVALGSQVPSDFRVYADWQMLKVILRNLLANAVKFSYPGGQVRLTVTHQEGAVEIAVRDQGVGMHPEQLAKLFKGGGMTTPGTMGEKGTGIGLELCLEFAERHGGSIRVESVPHQGSTFTLRLPQPTKAGDQTAS